MKKAKAPCSKMEKKINHVGEKGKTSSNMKTMNGVKQKPEKRDMLKPTEYPANKVDKKKVVKDKK